MDNPSGRVVSLVDSADGVRAVVEVKVAASCPRCAAGKGCGAGIFTASGGSAQPVEASVRAGLSLSEGDVVELTLAPDNLLRAAFIVYGLPMLGAIAGAGLAYGFSFRDAAAAIAALIGMAAGLMVSRWRVRQTSCLRKFVPVVERRVDGSGAGLQ
jgi:sigma-E factor negative regulatory protein RseC